METMNLNSNFSYRCIACGRCCSNKRVQTNPYEVLRLARNLGVSTGEFVRRFLEKQGPYLQVTSSGTCIFRDGETCGVHADRPLACRTYPLGRWVSAEAEETFRELEPHPHCEGIYSKDGTVEQFLMQQGAQPYMEAADKYQALFYRLFDAVQQMLPTNPRLADETQAAIFTSDVDNMHAFMELLDVDAAVSTYCKELRRDLPTERKEIVNLHIMAIDQRLAISTGG